MPCWATRTISLNLTAANQDLLMQALQQVGFQNVWMNNRAQRIQFNSDNASGYVANGQITLDERDQHLVNPLKQAYSRLTLQTVAKRYGWSLQGSGQTFTLQKRSF